MGICNYCEKWKLHTLKCLLESEFVLTGPFVLVFTALTFNPTRKNSII